MIDSTFTLNKTVAFYTLGCKLNFAETSTIGKELQALGYSKAKRGQPAGVCIVNTCSVTELADKKSRQTIRKIARENPSAYIIVTGCYAQLKPDEAASLEHVDLVLGNNQKLDLPRFLLQMEERGKGSHIETTPSKEITTFMPSCSADDRTRHFLKVQDGCDYFCSYCTVPLARGRSRNGAIADICRQATQAVADGAREIVLTGVNIGDFGKSTGETFADLVRALDQTEGAPRFRISSIEPNLLTDEVIELVARSHCFVPHFHIPLQSGCDEVLHLMRRRYDTALFAARIEKIKSLMPDAFIGVDVIVGTRGETDDYFSVTYDFLRRLPVSQLHVFSYSERAGTQALKIEHTVSPDEKHRRSQQLLELSACMTDAFYRSQIGTVQEVLFEQPKAGKRMSGFTRNYLRVEAPYDAAAINATRQVVLANYDPSEVVFTVNENGGSR